MIEAVFYLHKKDVIGYEISGHAHFATKGSDIVCAAVSVLSQAVTNGLTNAVLNDDNGISASLIEPNEKNKVLCGMLMYSLNEISNQYPENLKVKLHG